MRLHIDWIKSRLSTGVPSVMYPAIPHISITHESTRAIAESFPENPSTPPRTAPRSMLQWLAEIPHLFCWLGLSSRLHQFPCAIRIRLHQFRQQPPSQEAQAIKIADCLL